MQRIREQIGSAGLVVAIVALVAALAGGAYAASGSGENGATASAAGKQGPRGKQGKPGKQGAKGDKGDTGAAGLNGATGPAGAAGKEGAPGKEGKEGQGVEVSGATLAQCEERGGVVVQKAAEPASAKEVCNGKEGKEGVEGKAGPPLIPGGKLGAGETLTGGWSFNATAADSAGAFVAISFPVRLSGELGEEEVHYVTQEEVVLETQPAACPGNMNLPKALEGNLCVYESNAGEVLNATFDSILLLSNAEALGASRTGALLHFNVSGVAYGSGSWAVTGF